MKRVNPSIPELSDTTTNLARVYLDNEENALLAKLPTDIIFLILSYVRPSAISALSLSGKHLNLMLQDDQLWRLLFTSRFQIPIPNGTCLEAYKRHHFINQNITNGVYASQALEEHTDSIYSIALGVGSLYSASNDNTIKIWDLENNLCIQTLEGHEGWVCSLALGDGLLFSGSDDCTIKIWDLDKNICIQTLEGHTDGVFPLVLGHGRLFSGSLDSTIKIWDLKENLCIQTLEGHEDAVWVLALGHTQLFSASEDGTIKIWDLEKNLCLQTLEGHEAGVTSLALSNKLLFSGSCDKTIKIWDLETYQCIKTLNEHEGWVSSFALGDGLLFSGSCDNTIKIWDLETYQCIQTLQGYTNECIRKLWGCTNGHIPFTRRDKGMVFSIVFAGGKLFFSSQDKTIRIWDFCMSDSAIFAEIVELFRCDGSKEAMERFCRMPLRARKAIYGELYRILNPLAKDDMGCAEHAFHGQQGQKSTPEQKAQAIENYLKSVGKDSDGSV